VGRLAVIQNLIGRNALVLTHTSTHHTNPRRSLHPSKITAVALLFWHVETTDTFPFFSFLHTAFALSILPIYNSALVSRHSSSGRVKKEGRKEGGRVMVERGYVRGARGENFSPSLLQKHATSPGKKRRTTIRRLPHFL
jgi:hypothetical protein